MNGLTEGRIVHYILTQQDADGINQCRTVENIVDQPGWRKGLQAHVGSLVSAGEHVPMIIVRVLDQESGTVNGQAFLDGNDSLWATSVRYTMSMSESRTWHWIEKA